MTKRKTEDAKPDLRSISLDIMLEQESAEALEGVLIKNALQRFDYLDKRDRSFIRRLCEGTLEKRLTLDYIIDRFSKVKTASLKPLIRALLRMGTYQLYYMDHIPAGSVVNEAVSACRRRHMGQLAGYVNAVLRNIDRNRIDIQSIEDLTVRYSVPSWIITALEGRFGAERARKCLEKTEGRQKIYIRANAAALGEEGYPGLFGILKSEGVRAIPCPSRPGAFEISDFDSVDRLESFRKGLWSVQDLSSMSVGDEIEAFVKTALERGQRDFRVVDLCAAPGGKSAHAAEILKSRPLVSEMSGVLSFDISERKLSLIRENAVRLGLDNIETALGDALSYEDRLAGSSDVLIADLPCSCLGLLGRKNDIKYRVREEDIAVLAAQQREMLKTSAPYLKKGGLLVFSVCTWTREETLDNTSCLEEMGFKRLGGRQFMPWDDTDGFYYSIHTKNE